jgi:transcriptional regulator with XRE-family HTH domain
MINVSDYIKLILEKKGWTRVRLCEEINKIEAKLGESRTTKNVLSYYLNGDFAFRPKILAKWEKALGLKEGTLVNMVLPPITKEGKDELRETIERLRKV